MKRGHLVFILLALVGVWSGCRSAEPQDEPRAEVTPSVTATAAADIIIVEEGAPRLARVQPIPASVVLSPGETIGLSAIAFDQDGTELPQVAFTWRGIDPSAGTITPRGVFRAGFLNGTFNNALLVAARAPASFGQGVVQATVSVTIQDFQLRLQPAAIRVFPDKAEVEPRETLQLLAMAVDANGVVLPSMKFKWETLGPVAGTVSQDGRFTAGDSIGEFPSTIKVTLMPGEGEDRPPLTASLDVHVLDPAGLRTRVSATALPQVISLKPKERIRFTSIVLDTRGNQVTPEVSKWEIADPKAGSVTPSGDFTAAEQPGIYTDAVRVSMDLPGVDEPVIATATVIIVGSVITSPSGRPQGQAPRVVIFPERVVLSPGESAQVSIIGLEGEVVGVSPANVSWSLEPPEVGEVSRFVSVTANNYPGVYEGAIRATVTLNTSSGPVTQQVSATLVIRGTLNKVEIAPDVATVARGETVPYRAVPSDENGVLLPNILYKWSVSDPAIGSIDSNGVFTAKGRAGVYPKAILVRATQSRPPSSP